VFQDARLLPWKRVWWNVALGLHGEASRERAQAALHEVRLGHRLDATAGAYADPVAVSGIGDVA
jgi:sulfonate transport system ATP-binding protein